MPGGLPDEAFELGRTCALAAECGRDLRRCAEMYAGLFPAATFDGDFYTAHSLTAAFCAPWASADRLKMAGRTALWVLALDRLVDHTTASLEQVNTLIRDCLAVADGGAPRAAVTRFLADLRDELATVEGFAELHRLWRDQLARMLAGMARAWVWRDTRAEITLARFVGNADSRGTCFVDLSHWIYAGDAWAKGHLEELRAASERVQRYLHLLGDLASYRRDVSWGDLNVLTLGVSRGEVTDAMAGLAGEAAELIDRVRQRSPRAADYLWRQMGFNAGYNNISDYGRL
ncbi:terpene synthase family protein [Nonomuraea sp. ZG12]|uniref:terpene synthase family protein n=1 Tax=Nonomuraea sp. ZG12 TaxID=3452207 RepID=UPI003F891CB2